jgi:hypothetical protein
MPSSRLKVNKCFGGTLLLLDQEAGLKVTKVRNIKRYASGGKYTDVSFNYLCDGLK